MKVSKEDKVKYDLNRQNNIINSNKSQIINNNLNGK